MNRKQTLLLIAALAVAGVVSLLVSRKDSESWKTAANGKLLSFDLNEVSEVNLRQEGAELTLARKDDLWVVKDRADYPANFEKVSGLIRKLWEIKPVQVVKVGPSQLGRLNLVEPGQGADAGRATDAGAVLSFKNKEGKPVASLLVGKSHMRNYDEGPAGMPGFPVGRYLMALGGEKQAVLVSDSLSEVEAKPESWLDTAFIKVSNLKSVAVSGTAGAWKLTREGTGSDWKLDGAAATEQLDTAQTSGFNYLLSSASFADVLAPDAKPETTGLDKPIVATLETTEGFTYELKLGRPTNDKYPVAIKVTGNFAKERTPGKDEKPEDKPKLDETFQKELKERQEKLATEQKFEKRVYLLSKDSISALLKERKELLKAPEPTPTPTPAP